MESRRRLLTAWRPAWRRWLPGVAEAATSPPGRDARGVPSPAWTPGCWRVDRFVTAGLSRAAVALGRAAGLPAGRDGSGSRFRRWEAGRGDRSADFLSPFNRMISACGSTRAIPMGAMFAPCVLAYSTAAPLRFLLHACHQPPCRALLPRIASASAPVRRRHSAHSDAPCRRRHCLRSPSQSPGGHRGDYGLFAFADDWG